MRAMQAAFSQERDGAHQVFAGLLPADTLQNADPTLALPQWAALVRAGIEEHYGARESVLKEEHSAALLREVDGAASAVEELGKLNQALEAELGSALGDMELHAATILRDDRALHLQCFHIRGQLGKLAVALQGCLELHAAEVRSCVCMPVQGPSSLPPSQCGV